MALRPSPVPQRVVLPEPLASSRPHVPDPESDLARAASPTVTRLLATIVTDPDLESTAAFTSVTELVDFAARNHLDYVVSLVTESDSVCPPFVGGELALGTDVLEDKQFDLECLVAALPRLASILLCPEGDPDALDIPTLRSYAEAIAGEYSSHWKTAMDAEMASWKSIGTYMTTLWVLLHVATLRDKELHSLDFSIAFLQGSLHEEIRLRISPGFTGSFPVVTHLRRPVYSLHQAPREWHDTLRTTLAPSSVDPSLFLCTDTTLPPFYVLVYVRQCFGFQFSSPQPTPLSTGNSLSAPPSDEFLELSGPYPGLVGCLMYLMTCTRPDLAYPLSLLARYVAPGRHRKWYSQDTPTLLRPTTRRFSVRHRVTPSVLALLLSRGGATLADLPAERLAGAASFSSSSRRRQQGNACLVSRAQTGASLAPPAIVDSATCSQWLTRDGAACLAVRNHLLLAERAHFGQHKTAKALYDAVVARYSSSATAALGCLILPYIFPELSAFAIVEDLVSHLRTSDARYSSALPAEFLNRNHPPPKMYITLYFIVTRLPDSLCAIRDHFLALDSTYVIVDLLEKYLLAAKTSVVTVGAARGTPRTPFFEGCSPSPLGPSYASAVTVDILGAEDVGAASALSGKRRSSKGKGGRSGGGGSGGGSGGSNGGDGDGGGGGSSGSGGGGGGFSGGGGGCGGGGGGGGGGC
ncbi:unnamed protein product [Closterium sp. NIES-53]